MKNSEKKKNQTGIIERPPVVVVMGHIDHGKTTLLDFIRKTKVAEKESGGITQHIGAYEAEHKGKSITFIDTPGHEAFKKMRSRGAAVADIAILVVSAEEGVKPQTKEAIDIISQAGIPFVVAINKMDKPNADANRIKKDLAENNVLVEEYGGKIPAVEMSAKTGQNVDGLLDTLLLVAEIEELKWTPDFPCEGVVIDSYTDPRRGRAATFLVRNGTLRKGMFLKVSGAVTPVRAIENFRGEAVEEVGAAMPAVVFGLAAEALLGDEFRVFAEKSDAEAWAAEGSEEKTAAAGGLAEEGRITLDIILKTDVLGSREAIEHMIGRLQFQKVGARILKSETGNINESDVKMAGSGKRTLIVGFRVRLPDVLKELAASQNVSIIIHDVIYNLEDRIKEEMVKLVPSEIRRVDLGRGKALVFFKKERGRQIVGAKMFEGGVTRGALFDIERNKVKIGSGKVLGLQRDKRDTDEVKEGFEFGMLADASVDIYEGDTLLFFSEERTSPSLI